MQLQADELLWLHVEVGTPMVVGDTGSGVLTIIPITGGSVQGDGLRGRVLPGGADWSTQISPELAHVHALYWIETDDGAIISIDNEGNYNRLRNDAVIRTTPRFLCDQNGKYAYLMRDVFVAELRDGGKHAVDIVVYRMQ